MEEGWKQKNILPYDEWREKLGEKPVNQDVVAMYIATAERIVQESSWKAVRGVNEKHARTVAREQAQAMPLEELTKTLREVQEDTNKSHQLRIFAAAEAYLSRDKKI